jgi:general secretion pathway protein B
MSYILEALRRAESERERKRGGVPGLHARPVPMPSSDELGERRRNPWAWVAGAVTLGVLLLVLWRWWSVEPLVDESMLARAQVGGNVAQGGGDAPAASATPAPAAPAPAPATAPTPAPAEPAPQAAAPAPKAAASGAAPDKPPRSGKPATPPRSTATAATTPRKPPPQERTAPSPAAPAPQAAVPAPAPAPERLRSLAELPDDVRRSVPQLAFGGSVYSDTPAQRMVIFNGQVMREGDAVTDELQIEQIRPRSAVMRVRGQRFEMPF